MTIMRTLRSLSVGDAVAEVGKVEGHARLARVAERDLAPGVGGAVGVALGGEDALAADEVSVAMRCVTKAGVPGRAEGDDVAGAQARGRHDAVEDERAAVVGAGHRAAGDDVALVAQQRRHEDGEGEDQRGAGDQRDAEATAGEREGRGERHGSLFESARWRSPREGRPPDTARPSRAVGSV